MKYRLSLVLVLFLLSAAALAREARIDPVAENMLLLQTASGGWSKHFDDKAVDYGRSYLPTEIAALKSADRHDDATIDNKATTREIRYLADTYRETGNPAYLEAARRGVDYLLAAQYPNGGWPQYYPDRSLYRHQITYNDDAMVRVLQLLQDVAEGRDALAALTPEYAVRARDAVARGIACILATQLKIDGKPAIWAAQYDEVSLQPAKARSYELPSLAVSESVAIVRFLMRQPRPTPALVHAIEDAAQWLEQHRLRDTAMHKVEAPGEETGKDVLIETQPGASLWARFYDLQRQQPMFVNRQGEQVARFADIPNERRVGYAWYGIWPEKLLSQELPRWRKAVARSAMRAAP
jgi:pectinesterase